MANFETAIKKVLVVEGGYANHPLDKGGETMYGITKATAERYKYFGSMKDLPLETAKHIYYVGYWKRLRLDEIISQKIAEDLFDVCVNGGIPVLWAQKTINSMNTNNTIKEDGIIGPKTIAELNKIKNCSLLEKIFRKIYSYYRIEYYMNIVKANPKQKIFFLGWINRLVKMN